MIIILISYWIFFFRHILFNPYSLAYGEALDCDFSTQRLCGEYWHKGKIPQDPYYFGDVAGARAGTYYPINILFAYVSSFFNLNHAWVIHTWNILLHSLATSIFAYYLFGRGLIGLFGALAWGYFGYHIKGNLWWVQSFTWITTTLCFIHHPILASVSLGMLIYAGTPPLVAYTIYSLVIYYLIVGYNIIIFPLAIVIALPQIIAYLRYYSKSIRTEHTYEDKVIIGKVSPWRYLTTFIPLDIKNYIYDVGYWETAFYLTPLVFFFALFGNPFGWMFVLFFILLSSGGMVFKLLSPFMARFPQRWGYFACLGVIILSVEGLRTFNLPATNLILLNILLGSMLLFNRSLLPIYPFVQWTKKPLEYFKTPLLSYLRGHSGRFRVSNLPYPVYSGQIAHIKSLGYCGGNHYKWLGKLRNIPKQGAGGYNWFEFKEDGEDLDAFGVKYHIGERPSKRWKKVKGFNLYKNG